MNPKGVCRECGEIVPMLKLVFSPESGITENKEVAPLYLTASHPPKVGHKVTKVVSIPSGKVVEVSCNGSMRPPKETILVH